MKTLQNYSPNGIGTTPLCGEDCARQYLAGKHGFTKEVIDKIITSNRLIPLLHTKRTPLQTNTIVHCRVCNTAELYRVDAVGDEQWEEVK